MVVDASSVGADHFETRVALQPDGKIVLGGWLSSPVGVFAARLNADGSLNTGFNGTGKRAWKETTSTTELIHAMTLLPDGRILLVGANDGGGTRTFLVYRIDPDGLDLKFTRLWYGTEVAEAYGLVMQADGMAVLGGFTAADAGAGTPADFELMRCTADWHADTTFAASHGRATTGSFPAPVQGSPGGLALQPDGRLVVVGTFSAGGPTVSDCVLVRYDANGNLDRSFGGGSGMVITNLTPLPDRWTNVALQPDGMIVACATVQTTTTRNVAAVARFTADGQPDLAFGTAGVTQLDFGDFRAVPANVAILPDGRLVVAGYYFSSTTFAATAFLARLNANGTPDTSFGPGGIVTPNLGTTLLSINDAVLQADGKLLVCGSRNSLFLLARFSADGTPDPSFGGTGIVTTTLWGTQDLASGLAIQADGRILAGGYATNSSWHRSFAVVRYQSDGSLDTGFAAGGIALNDFGSLGATDGLGYGIALAADGRIVQVGKYLPYTPGSGGSPPVRVNDFAMLRLTSTGAGDPTFGTNGVLHVDRTPPGAPYDYTETASKVAIQPDGRMIVIGKVECATSTGGPVQQNNWAVARFFGDTTFHPLQQTSSPPGWITTTTWSPAGSLADTVTAASVIDSGAGRLRFAEWQVDGARWPDYSGTATNPATSIAIKGSRLATAIYLPEDQDLDGNCLADWWQRYYFGTASVMPTADADGDGQGNLAEQIAGTDPRDPASTFRVIRVDGQPVGHFTLTWTAVPDGIPIGGLVMASLPQDPGTKTCPAPDSPQAPAKQPSRSPIPPLQHQVVASIRSASCRRESPREGQGIRQTEMVPLVCNSRGSANPSGRWPGSPRPAIPSSATAGPPPISSLPAQSLLVPPPALHRRPSSAKFATRGRLQPPPASSRRPAPLNPAPPHGPQLLFHPLVSEGKQGETGAALALALVLSRLALEFALKSIVGGVICNVRAFIAWMIE